MLRRAKSEAEGSFGHGILSGDPVQRVFFPWGHDIPRVNQAAGLTRPLDRVGAMTIPAIGLRESAGP